MSDIFISHVEEDSDVALELALRLEEAGYRTWSYEIDSMPGPSYLIQTGRSIEQSQAVVLIISKRSLSSNQLTREVVRAHESGKYFIPVLRDVTHTEFQNRQPEWREAIGAATSIRIPGEGGATIVPRVIDGLRALGIHPRFKPDTKRIEVISKALSELKSGAISGEGTKVVPVAESGERPSSIRGTRPLLIVLISVILIALIVLLVALPKGLSGMIVLGLAILVALIVWRRQIRARLKMLRPAIVMGLRIRRRPIRLLLIALALAAIVAAIVVPVIILGSGTGRQGGSFGNATPTPTATLTPTITPASTIDILSFSDNFQDGVADGWQLGHGWSVALDNGNYMLEAKPQDPNNGAWPLVSSASNYILEADFEIVSGMFEIDVRQNWGGTHYNVWISASGVQLGRCIGPPTQHLLNEPANMGFGQWHNLSIALDGGSIKVYIDHQLEIDYLDEDPLPAGSFIIISSPNSIIHLDNILVRPSGTPTATPAKSLDPFELVNFADLNLETAIQKQIGKLTGDIHISDLRSLTELVADNAGITDLSGLEYCRSLAWLGLGNNSISDISPLSNLTNLQFLHIGHNQISDISPLSNLHNLTNLSLNYNPVNELGPISSLSNLIHLYIQGCQINDLSFLSNLVNLQTLVIEYTQISNISLLSNLTSLTKLQLEGIQVSDISPLSALEGLTELILCQNQISDISLLSSLTNLTILDLGVNQINDISPVVNLSNLSTLYLSRNEISNISPLSNLTNLTHLELQSNQINSIYPLLQNPGLGEGDWVDLRGNPLGPVSITSYIPQLEQRGVNVWSD